MTCTRWPPRSPDAGLTATCGPDGGGGGAAVVECAVELRGTPPPLVD